MKTQSVPARLLREAEIIVWDEAPTAPKQMYEALDIFLRDLMGVGWLKKQIKQWTPKDITSLILSSNCVENYYTPNAKNKEYLMAQCRENQALYKDSQNLPQQMYWRNTLEVINMWHKVSPEAMHAVHVLNWIRKHR